MNNHKATKRALLTSVMALVMCVVMLVGTTFAWFTDTATADVNKIQVGNLDVALYYGDTADGANGTNWTELVNGSPALKFIQANNTTGAESYWEPGGTYSLPALKVVNKGNLNLKYKIEITGIKGSAKLNDVIDWTMKLDGADFAIGSEHVLNAATAGTESADILTISGHMRETAGNTYMNEKIEGITITLKATQATGEYDSTTNDYDKDAPYTTVNVSNEKELRTALFNAPTDGGGVKIVLQDNITLKMLYSPTLFSHSNEASTWKSHGMTEEAAAAEAAKPENGEVADNDTQYNTLAHYKIGVMPTAENPSQWNPLVTNQTLEERAQFGAYIHSGDTRCARLVVKSGQDVIIDLNGKTIAKRADATHGSWSATDTDIIANYGMLKITDSANGGKVVGRGYYSCVGAVLHNYSGAIMTVEKAEIDGNAAGFTAGTGQYVIANDGGTVVIDGANVHDTATSASLVVNTAGTMTIKGNAALNHPNTKTINCKGGEVFVESAKITSNAYSVYAAGGTVTVTNSGVTVTGSGTMTEDGGTIVHK